MFAKSRKWYTPIIKRCFATRSNIQKMLCHLLQYSKDVLPLITKIPKENTTKSILTDSTVKMFLQSCKTLNNFFEVTRFLYKVNVLCKATKIHPSFNHSRKEFKISNDDVPIIVQQF